MWLHAQWEVVPAGNARVLPWTRREGNGFCSSGVQLELLGFHRWSDQPAAPECGIAKVLEGVGVLLLLDQIA